VEQVSRNALQPILRCMKKTLRTRNNKGKNGEKRETIRVEEMKSLQKRTNIYQASQRGEATERKAKKMGPWIPDWRGVRGLMSTVGPTEKNEPMIVSVTNASAPLGLARQKNVGGN